MAQAQQWLAPWVVLQEVPFTDTTALIKFVVGTYVETPIGSYSINGCDTYPMFAWGSPVYTGAQIMCAPGQTGVTLLTHEVWWHLFWSWCHYPISNHCGGASANQMPPADGNCVAGQAEAARWIYQVPPGSFPR